MQDFIKATAALSDITRLRMMNILLIRECCVCEVMQALEISQTRASRNLSILYDAGFLKQRKEGLWTVYSIDREGIGKENKKYLDNIIKAVSSALENSKTAEADIARLEKSKRISPACP
ncbi:MAG TPA: ArsR family transcriptional regulator [Dehalococcoidia bacterium]|nr:ArsR family transcriptional regulator [Dehalococcoidia bacterium]HAS27996.1 ArsR family transcriptional regulator [Dehalococcoidia bacterium]